MKRLYERNSVVYMRTFRRSKGSPKCDFFVKIVKTTSTKHFQQKIVHSYQINEFPGSFKLCNEKIVFDNLPKT